MKDIIIRKAVEKDFTWILAVSDEVAELHRIHVPWKFKKSETESFPYLRFQADLNDEKQRFYVAELEEKVIWFVLFSFEESSTYPIMKQREYLFVDSLWVLEEFQKEWVGKRLMQLVETEAKERWIKEIELDVRNFNKKALWFYEKWWYSVFNCKMRKEVEL